MSACSDPKPGQRTENGDKGGDKFVEIEQTQRSDNARKRFYLLISSFPLITSHGKFMEGVIFGQSPVREVSISGDPGYVSTLQ